MSDINPTEIYRRYQIKELNKVSAVGYLKTIIESSSDEELRVRSVELLGEMNLEVGEIFKFLEHLMISDISEEIRIASARLIIAQYLEVGEDLLKWVFQHEQSVDCLLELQKALLLNINQKNYELLAKFEKIFNNRFPDYNCVRREEMGIGQAERLLGKIQPYLFDVEFYEDLDTLALDKLYDEIVELAELELINNCKTVKIMQLISDRYIVEAEAEHDWHEIWLSYQKAMISSEFGLIFDPNGKELLFNFGVACNYLDLYYPGIKAFLRLYKIEKKLDKKKYKETKKFKKQGGKVLINQKATSLEYLVILFNKTGLIKKEKWAKKRKKKRKAKMGTLLTNF